MTTGPSGGRPVRSPALATFLSFLWPGLGQFYVGARRAALVFALPVAIVALVLGLQALGGVEGLIVQILTPSIALTVLILIGLFGLWRLLSMGDALVTAGRRGSWRRPVPIVTFVLLGAVVIGSHGVAAGGTWLVYEAANHVFIGVADPEAGPSVGPSGSVESGVPGDSAQPTPEATPTVARSRINILLTGIDSDKNRDHRLNDTLLVLSIDPKTGDIAMISFPRDLARLPTPDGGTYDGKINSLMSYAERRPNAYPAGGMAALANEVGFLLGAPIDYYAAVDLNGFKTLIDRVGGVTVDVKQALNDPGYGGWTQPGRVGFRLSKGKHTLDGETALAYVRTRKGAGDNDFNRARRQQELLLALQKKLADPAMLTNLPGILDDVAHTLTTDFPPERLSEMLTIARAADTTAVKRYVLGPPYAERPTDAGDYILVPDMARFARLSMGLFGAESRYATE